MTVLIVERWNVTKLLQDVMKDYLWTPQQLWAMTPAEIYALFGKQAGSKNTPPDRDAELQRHNEMLAAKGKRPVVPSWLWPKLRG